MKIVFSKKLLRPGPYATLENMYVTPNIFGVETRQEPGGGGVLHFG